MTRPRILLVPTVTEVEWRIKPLLEEWAEVASFDAPGIGDEPMTESGPTLEAILERGRAEIERQAWQQCIIAGDESGAAHAVRLAASRPEAVRALALGHPAISFERTGPRRAINGEMFDALFRLARTDYRSYVRALCQITQQAYDDDLAERYMARVPQEIELSYIDGFVPNTNMRLEPLLRSLEVPMLFVEHHGCLGWTHESFEDAVAAFPDAATGRCEVKPSCDPEFAKLLKDFCETLPAREEAKTKQSG
jgi:pimeloyl-ACP methyl ester carboxylesterase